MFILAGVYGPQLYKIYVMEGLTFAHFFEIIAHLLGVFTTLPMVFYNIYL